MTWQGGNDYTGAPVWFKLQRAGNVLTGYQSADGENWFKVGSGPAALPDQCYIGLASTGNKPGSVNISVFDHVSVQTAPR
jgi:hypothetical protein